MAMITTTVAERGGVLRVITAGSVDDGKSTLIGRLLYDSRAILADQLAALANARHKRSLIEGEDIDLALLTDGLEAEREQGITIDVAYRYFATARRKFILADAPGHEQYTRNMVTGASNSDAAIVLIDATRVEGARLLEQTYRHLAIASLLGLSHLIIAVNKMDRIGFDAARFEAIRESVSSFAARLGRLDLHFIPLSALLGTNVVTRSVDTPWYQGPSLLELLESLPLFCVDGHAQPLRFPVQLVLRAGGDSDEPYRAYAGRIESGRIARGDQVQVMPGGHSAVVRRITRFDRELSEAHAGSPCAVELDRDLDISRGDCLVSAIDPPVVARSIEADVCWLDSDPFVPGRRYYLRQMTREVTARITEVEYRRDIRTLEPVSGVGALNMNDLGRIRVSLAQPVVVDPFDRHRATGCFILVDAATHQTAAAGLIRNAYV